jgi:hypothetical protein
MKKLQAIGNHGASSFAEQNRKGSGYGQPPDFANLLVTNRIILRIKGTTEPKICIAG